MRDLAAAAGVFHHRGLGGAAVDDERAAQAGGGIRGGQAEQFAVFIERLVVFRRVGAGRYGTLRHDHHETRARYREQCDYLIPRHLGKSEVRQTPGHRPEQSDAASAKIQAGAQGNRASHGDERSRQARRELGRAENDRHHRCRNRERGPVQLGQMGDDRPELKGGLPAVHRDAEHFAQHRDADLEADAGKEADQHRAREEVR